MHKITFQLLILASVTFITFGCKNDSRSDSFAPVASIKTASDSVDYSKFTTNQAAQVFIQNVDFDYKYALSKSVDFTNREQVTHVMAEADKEFTSNGRVLLDFEIVNSAKVQKIVSDVYDLTSNLDDLNQIIDKIDSYSSTLNNLNLSNDELKTANYYLECTLATAKYMSQLQTSNQGRVACWFCHIWKCVLGTIGSATGGGLAGSAVAPVAGSIAGAIAGGLVGASTFC